MSVCVLYASACVCVSQIVVDFIEKLHMKLFDGVPLRIFLLQKRRNRKKMTAREEAEEARDVVMDLPSKINNEDSTQPETPTDKQSTVVSVPSAEYIKPQKESDSESDQVCDV